MFVFRFPETSQNLISFRQLLFLLFQREKSENPRNLPKWPHSRAKMIWSFWSFLKWRGDNPTKMSEFEFSSSIFMSKIISILHICFKNIELVKELWLLTIFDNVTPLFKPVSTIVIPRVYIDRIIIPEVSKWISIPPAFMEAAWGCSLETKQISHDNGSRIKYALPFPGWV